VTAVLGVSVTAKTGGVRAMHRQMFDQGIAQVSTELKEYVTACGCRKNTGDCSAPAGGCTLLPGPNSQGAGVGKWYINGAAGAGGNITDTAGNVWALKSGAHTLRGVVPSLEAAPYNGSITYTVTWPSNDGLPLAPTDAPAIQFSANWTEP
jgi:hypothetical protein